jgi:hypothetical protein
MKPPKSNLSKKEHEALRNLNNNEDIIVLKVEKSRATVIMNPTLRLWSTSPPMEITRS